MAIYSRGEAMPADMTRFVAECAYFKAERRGFVPGFELDDWLEAEREMAAMMAAPKPKRRPAAPKTTIKKKTRAKNGAAATT